MFSGHTAATTLLVMMWTHYSRGEELAICFGPCRGVLTSNVDAAGDPMGWKLFDLVLWAYAIVLYWVILVTRFHYSNDGRLTHISAPSNKHKQPHGICV